MEEDVGRKKEQDYVTYLRNGNLNHDDVDEINGYE